ncbi:MAG: hypothetical protein KW804_00270 [Candidatus Doudnabacteria bacterium]|nr:hypothetical protein [Candidatus Doudnabacteria bacterium]
MILLLDTSDFDLTKIVLKGEQVFEHTFESKDLSEKIVHELKSFLAKRKLEFSNIEKVEIKTGSHFSRTRTTVAVANALIYALKLKQKPFKPSYNREPNITLKKKQHV